MAKKTLRDELEAALRDKEYFRGRAEVNQEAKNELDKRNRDSLDMYKTNEAKSYDMNRQLLEIVRWHVNPKTAEFPYQAEKDQRDPSKYPPNY